MHTHSGIENKMLTPVSMKSAPAQTVERKLGHFNDNGCEVKSASGMFTLRGQPVETRATYVQRRNEALETIAKMTGWDCYRTDRASREVVDYNVTKLRHDIAKCETWLAKNGGVPARPFVKAATRPTATKRTTKASATHNAKGERYVDQEVVNGILARFALEHGIDLRTGRDLSGKR